MRPMIVLSVLVFAAGCETVPEGEQPLSLEQRPAAASAAKLPAAKAGAEAKAVARPDIAALDVRTAGKDLKDSSGIPPQRSVFFAYDRFEIQEEYRPMIAAHARYLRENPDARMLIQGNADERGSREYNLALGQRRSENVKKVLLLLGASQAQIESVSLGEEKPRCAGQSEDCWAKNRRGDILFGSEY